MDAAFQVFVKRAVEKIKQEAWGRSQENRDIRAACDQFLGLLESKGTKMTTPLSPEEQAEVLNPLVQAAMSTTTRISDPALGCLHKLVSHAWLQGESSIKGGLDEDNVVSQVTKIFILSSTSPSKQIQLSVIRGLLTICTAEHFVIHGESLMQTVRSVHNLALSSEDNDLKRTACNALLQISNTLVKKATNWQNKNLSKAGSMRSQEAAIEDLNGVKQFNSFQSRGDTDATLSNFPELSLHNPEGYKQTDQSQQSFTERVLNQSSSKDNQDFSLPRPLDVSTKNVDPNQAQEDQSTPRSDQIFQALEAMSQVSGKLNNEDIQNLFPHTFDNQGGSANSPSVKKIMELAENQDLQQLQLALDDVQRDKQDIQEFSLDDSGGKRIQKVQQPCEFSYGLDNSSSFQMSKDLQDSKQGYNKENEQENDQDLNVQERDVIMLFTAYCKLGAREDVTNMMEEVIVAGKFLALELLTKIIQHVQTNWNEASQKMLMALRPPLCLVLLKNCLSKDPKAAGLLCHLFGAILRVPKIRQNMKAELAAFYPLIVLRQLEQTHYSPVLFITVLQAVRKIFQDPQFQIELYVNYDCDLEGANLYERTLLSLSKVAAGNYLLGPEVQATEEVKYQIAQNALLCLADIVKGLESWSEPLRNKALETYFLSRKQESHKELDEQMQSQVQSPKLDQVMMSNMKDDLPFDGREEDKETNGSVNEVQKFELAKQKKDQFKQGIILFNTNPKKGIQLLKKIGFLDDSPQEIVKFLFENSGKLSRQSIGDYFGEPDDINIQVMHCFIDEYQDYKSISIDEALRILLRFFKLPGEAQKIDRIMEKFAEKFCTDNPKVFRNADGPYILSFSIIMLNTDLHNPMAEHKLTKESFIQMGCVQNEEGQFENVLPQPELEQIFDRIQRKEFEILEDIEDSEYSIIKKQEMQVQEDINQAQSQKGNNNKKGNDKRGTVKSSNGKAQDHQTLAFAMGLPQNSRQQNWDKNASQIAEKQKFLRNMFKQGHVKNLDKVWYQATHSEHIKPILNLAGKEILYALQSSLANSQLVKDYDFFVNNVLYSIRSLVIMSCVCNLQELLQATLQVLSDISGAASPAIPQQHPAISAIQLESFRTLVYLANGQYGGFLGQHFPILLRCLSDIEQIYENTQMQISSLKAMLMQGQDVNNPAIGNSKNQFSVNSTQYQLFKQQIINLNMQQNFQELFDIIEDALNNDKQIDLNRQINDYLLMNSAGGLFVLWLQNEGNSEIEKIFYNSQYMDGNSVVVFVRSLCAVSQEELEPGSDAPARVFCLQKLAETAYANQERLRFVWARIWKAISSHLVGASCNSEQTIQIYSLDLLKQLVLRLIQRNQLTNYTYQEECLRPFIQVLRHGISPEVKGMTIECIQLCVLNQGTNLGSGWKKVAEAIIIGACDNDPKILHQTYKLLDLYFNLMVYYQENSKGKSENGAKSEEVRSQNEKTEKKVISAVEIKKQNTRAFIVMCYILVRNQSAIQLSMQALEKYLSIGEALAIQDQYSSTKDKQRKGETTAMLEQNLSFLPVPKWVEIPNLWICLAASLCEVMIQDPRDQIKQQSWQMLIDLIDNYSQKWNMQAYQDMLENAVVPAFDVQQHIELRQAESRNLMFDSTQLDHYISICLENLPKLCHLLAKKSLLLYPQIQKTYLNLIQQMLRFPYAPVQEFGLQLFEFFMSQLTWSIQNRTELLHCNQNLLESPDSERPNTAESNTAESTTSDKTNKSGENGSIEKQGGEKQNGVQPIPVMKSMDEVVRMLSICMQDKSSVIMVHGSRALLQNQNLIKTLQKLPNSMSETSSSFQQAIQQAATQELQRMTSANIAPQDLPKNGQPFDPEKAIRNKMQPTIKQEKRIVSMDPPQTLRQHHKSLIDLQILLAKITTNLIGSVDVAILLQLLNVLYDNVDRSAGFNSNSVKKQELSQFLHEAYEEILPFKGFQYYQNSDSSNPSPHFQHSKLLHEQGIKQFDVQKQMGNQLAQLGCITSLDLFQGGKTNDEEASTQQYQTQNGEKIPYEDSEIIWLTSRFIIGQQDAWSGFTQIDAAITGNISTIDFPFLSAPVDLQLGYGRTLNSQSQQIQYDTFDFDQAQSQVMAALGRQEIEGGHLVLESWQKIWKAIKQTDGAQQQPYLQTVQKKLLNYCEQLIKEEAQKTTHSETQGDDLAYFSVLNQKNMQEKASNGHKGGEEASQKGPIVPVYNTQWEEASRASLIVKALEIYKSVRGDEFQEDVKSLYPSLAILINSKHQCIREAVKIIFSNSMDQLMQAQEPKNSEIQV